MAYYPPNQYQPQYPPQYPQYPPPRRTVSRRTVIAVVAAAASIVLVLGVVVAMLLLSRPASAETALEPVNTAQADAFLPQQGGNDATGVTPPAGATGPVTGSTPGLFGGTNDNRTCDREQMIRFLASNPDKGAAWARVAGIDTSDIPDFIRHLSPLILRADTAVTNHGYRGGELTTYPAVLQAGTAVLVDGYGTPRAKCYCGNPLSAPRYDSAPRYSGVRWTRFSPVTVIVVRPAPVVIQQITIVNVYNQKVVRQPLPPFRYPSAPVPPSESGSEEPVVTSSPSDLLAPGDPAAGPVDPNLAPGLPEDTTTTTTPTTTTDTTTTTETTTTTTDEPPPN